MISTESADKLDMSFVKWYSFYSRSWTRHRVLCHLYDVVWRFVPFIGNAWVTAFTSNSIFSQTMTNSKRRQTYLMQTLPSQGCN